MNVLQCVSVLSLSFKGPNKSHFRKEGKNHTGFLLVGLVYFIVLTIYLIFIMQYALKSIVSKKNINNYIKAETMALGIFVLVKMIFEPVLFGGTIPVYLFTTFCLCRFIINCEQIKENRFNENFNN